MITSSRHALRAVALLAAIPLTSSALSSTPESSGPQTSIEGSQHAPERLQPSDPKDSPAPTAPPTAETPSATPGPVPSDPRPGARPAETVPDPTPTAAAPEAEATTVPATSPPPAPDTAPASVPPSPTRPAAATGIQRTTTTTSVAITWTKVPGATGYTVCLLPTPTAPACSHRSALSPAAAATFTGLTPQPGTDFHYRVISHNAAGQTASATLSFDLAVATVTGLTASPDGKQRIVLTWPTAVNASKYTVQIATNRTMTAGLLTGTSATPTYTSSTLQPGTVYYFRVRGTNDAVAGSYSAVGELSFGTPGTNVRIVTYNLCGQDKCVTSANKMKRWSSTRKPLAGSLVRAAAPDIVATQESTTSDTNFGSELPGFKMSHYKSAKSLFYKTSKYSLVSSGEITLSSSLKKYAVWADLKDVNGTRLIVVNLHLVSGKGKSNDDERTREMTALINGVKKINPSGLPVVYAGDFNSNKSNANQSKYKGGYDAPLRSFRAIGVIDSSTVAKVLTNHVWNSANQAKNPPLKHSDHVDHVYISPDIKATSWKMLLRLSGSSYAVPFASDHNALVVDLTVPGR